MLETESAFLTEHIFLNLLISCEILGSDGG
jgi:hypothetical protein